MKYKVTKQHIAEFPNPITLIKGERVRIGEDPNPEVNPDTWVNWLTDKWKPYRSYASLYLWRSLDNK